MKYMYNLKRKKEFTFRFRYPKQICPKDISCNWTFIYQAFDIGIFLGNINYIYAQLIHDNLFVHYVYHHISHGTTVMSEWVILLSAK